MANISLRSYHQEIERLIDSGRTDEAITHCRHILQTYPRCVDTYRLLGKTFLESQRYGDAADILQRVLSSIPDDFVAHVGMSIIREDEGNLDEAIWHMERAFEAQPSNGAIQDELRRLYERRDGVEPPKIRLTRGALARMYAKGNLYAQAIAEARAVLAKEEKRLDILVILASAQAKAGKLAEAAESANTVLQKLPYCLVANQVMAEVLAQSDREEDAQSYQQRASSLDPYNAFIDTNYPTVADVPEQVVTLEKLVYKPGETPIEQTGQPGWAASLGVNVQELETQKDEMPAWLSGTAPDDQDEEPAPEQIVFGIPAFEDTEEKSEPEELIDVDTEDEIPDWMKEAGWAPSTGAAEDTESSFGFDEAVPSEDDDQGELAEAEIPPWLQAMAPQEGVESEGVPAGAEAVSSYDMEAETPDWLAESEGKDIEIPDWLSDITAEAAPIDAEEDQTVLSEVVEETPDIVSEIEKPEIEIPDWLTADAESASGKAPQPSGMDEIEIPDWLSEAEDQPTEAPEEAEAANGMPAWLAAAGAGALAAKALRGKEDEDEELPEWLAAAEAGESIAAEPDEVELPEWLAEAEQEAQAEPELPEWLAAFDAGESHDKEPTEPELPEWLTEPQAEEEVEADIEAEVEPVEEEFDLTDRLAAAGAEVLAAETLIEDKEETEEEAELPEWLAETDVEEAEEVEAEVELEEAELPEWLSEVGAEEEIEEVEAEVEPVEEAFDLAGKLAAAGAAVLAAETLIEDESEAEEEAELPEWLTETEVEEVEVEAEFEEAELPEWLAEIEAEAPSAEEMVEAEAADEIEAEEAEAEAEEVEAELLEWLAETEVEEVEAEAEIEEAALPELLEEVEVEAEAEVEEAELPEWLAETEVEEAEEIIEEVEGEVEPGEEAFDLAGKLAAAGAAVLAAETLIEDEEEAEAEEAELPEWLSEVAPQEEVAEVVAEVEIEEAEIPELLEEVEVEAEAEVEEAELPEWLSETEVEEIIEEVEGEVEPVEEAFDLTGKLAAAGAAVLAAETLIEDKDEAEEEAEIPEWLAETEAEEVEAEEEIEEAELPEWLEEIEVEAEAEAEEAELPEWLSEVAPGEELAEVVAEVEIEEAELPEFLEEVEVEAEAGAEEAKLPEWLAETEVEEAEEISKEVEAEVEPVEEAFELTEKLAAAGAAVLAAEALIEDEEEAEIPEWLAETEVEEVEAEMEIEEAELPEFLEEVEVEAEAEAEEAELPEWLAETEVEEVEAEVEIEKAELPEWLEEIEVEAEAEQLEGEPEAEAAKIPEWLAETEVEEAEETFEEVEEEGEPVDEGFGLAGKLAAAGAAVLAAETLIEDEEAAEEEAEIPEWLAESEVEEVEAEEESEEAELPEWMMEVDSVAPFVETAEESAEEETFDWLDITESESEAASEEAPAVPADHIPDWLQPPDSSEMEADLYLGDTQPTRIRTEEEELPLEEPPVAKFEPEAEPEAPAVEIEPEPAYGEQFLDDDAAFAWLESLAVKQGAEEALLLSPEERQDTPPEWVQKITPEIVDEAVETTEGPPEFAEPEPALAETALEVEDEFGEPEPIQAEIAADVVDEFEIAEAIPTEDIDAQLEEAQIEAEFIEPEVEAADSISEDTAPKALDDAAAFAWLESLAVKQGAEEALLLTPEERQEAPPEWVDEAGEETPAEAVELEVELEDEFADETPAEILAEIEEGEVEVVELEAEEIEELAPEPSAPLDDDAAFAWLESLAVQQGADEALILTPEQRQEAPPEWVQQAEREALEEAVEAEAEVLEEVVEVEDEAFIEAEAVADAVEAEEELLAEAVAEEAIAEVFEAEEEALVEVVEADVKVAASDAEIDEWLSADVDLGEVVEEIPDLPDWLARESTGDTGPLEWTPPPVQFDLNEASLAELERLPGIGFIMAQRIINRRDQVGYFNQLNDLLEIPGFEASNLTELQSHLFVKSRGQTEQLRIPTAGEKPFEVSEVDAAPELAEARHALNQGEIDEAINQYTKLILSSQALPGVIGDLTVAAEHFPRKVALWQCLGDAYLRTNQIAEALDAYVKAEELLR